ncbi:MAG: WxL domain-containing protein [Lactococcus plantarum]|nr:WxL domain-containing protein [Lactococcus plantarum]MDN6070879.1 WxL domain-containing protein [Lactococcus plantarum]MDN6085162.1 WxL domain-containing protein [Lactococcus plantarum]
MKKVLTHATQSLIILAAGLLVAMPVAADSVVKTTSDGTVGFKENNSSDIPIVNPEAPNEEIHSDTTGPLSLNYVSSIAFGKQELSTKQETYYADLDSSVFKTGVAPFVEMVDARGAGNDSKTAVTVTQVSQFKSGKNTLDGAALTFSMGRAVNAGGGKYIPNSTDKFTLVPGTAQTVMETDGTVGQYLTSYGTAKDYQDTTKGSPISLTVPAGAAVKGDYTATLQWDLTTAP